MAEPPREAGQEDASAIISYGSKPGSSQLPVKRKFEEDSERRIVWPPVVVMENTLTHYQEDASAIISYGSTPGNSQLPVKRKFEEDSERRIVWPPVVVIENTLTHYDTEQKRWKGLENDEVRTFLKNFKDINFTKVSAVYGKFERNMGKSLVTFPPTPWGYMDAQKLSEMLENDHRGRRHWLRVCRVENPFGPGKATPDGKKILYGYLASQRDMEENDRTRKIVKRWSMESYVEKVLQPLDQCGRGAEEARRKREELLEQARQKQLSIEQNRVEVDKAAAKYREISEESESQRKHEEELESMHRKTFEERKRVYELQKLEKLENYKQCEMRMREKLKEHNLTMQQAVTKLEQLSQRLRHGIDSEKKKLELQNAEERMSDLMKLDSTLQLELEKRLAALKEKFMTRQLELQQKHNQQIMKSKERLSAEKEKFLQDKLEELNKIQKESKEAKTLTQKEIERECIICFCDMVEEKRERALFMSCKHANMCSKCAEAGWKVALKKKERYKCPTCNAEQTKKFSLLPASIYK
ncbi:hypothetical protein KP509_09G097400 [Ceratopteris richardii]|uniref:RING-type domain-containing protein n=1 Tax=Ceratopteris richardii TaxID=49495 RepID=A0A8T2U9F6_CERRI|nr:hypothetical protein KP509_09G097400 [Ceratopteris richardii]